MKRTISAAAILACASVILAAPRHGLSGGTYTAAVGHGEFKVINGILTGDLKPLTSAILYR